MLRVIVSLALFWSVGAWGADYWVDFSGTGTGAADGSDVDNLCADTTDADCAESAGDTVYLCNARTSQWVPDVSGSSGNPITYEWSCPGGTAASIETSSGSGLSLSSDRSYLTMNDATLTQTGTARCVNIAGADNIIFNRGTIGPCAQTSTGAEGAIVFSATVDSDDVVFNSTEVTNPRGNCIALINATGSIDYSGLQFNNMNIHDCGNAADEHGIRLKVAAAAAATITDPLVSGGSITNAYDYAIDWIGTDTTATEKIIDPVIDGVTIRDSGQRGPDTGTGGGAIRLQNTLRAMVKNSDLSENIGNGGGLVALYSQDGFIQDNECSRMTSLSNQIDGGGIDIDHGNDNMTVRRNRCQDNDGNATAVNSGYGIMVLDSTNTHVYDNILTGNKIGISYNPQDSGGPGLGQDNVFTHNIMCGNDRDGAHINQDSTAENSEWYNNVLCGNGRYGFSVGDADSNQIANYNSYYLNATGNYSNQSAGANDLTADPQFVGGINSTTAEGFRLKAASPLIDAGTCYRTHGCAHADYGGRTRGSTPSIGAWENASGDAAQARTAATRTAASARTAAAARTAR